MKAEQELLHTVESKAKAWTSELFDEDTRKAVKNMLESNPDELIESFYKDLEFGTGGLRGIMGPGTNRVNKYTIGMATQGLANYLLASFAELKTISVAIAYDCRNQSKFFAETTANVFVANGIQAYLFESLRPTPELSFAIRELGCQSGIVITASHNPKEYNGYKVYWDDGGQIISPHDEAIIAEVANIQTIDEVKFSGGTAKIMALGKEMDDKYLKEVKSLSLNPELIKKYSDLKIVYTPIHGTGVELVPNSLKDFGFTSVFNVPEQDVTDGNFPTVISPNPEEKAALNMAIQKAKEVQADIVMATDPDADRVGIAVNNGDNEFILLNGNQTGSLLVYYMLNEWKNKGLLKGNEFIVKTIVTSPLFSEIANSYGVNSYEVLTGFKYIANIIKEKEGHEKFIVGGEESYGYLAGDFIRDKDAVMSCALIAEVAVWAKSKGLNMMELLDEVYVKFGLFKEHLISIVRKGKSGSEEIAAIMENLRSNPPLTLAGSDVVMIHDFRKQKSVDMISDLRYDIKLPKSNVLQFLTQDGSIISIRPSGTEPKIKFYFSTRKKIDSAEELKAAHKSLEEKIQKLVVDIGAQ
ncbi:MAG: phospho-sugar mutase [Bacteroidales bacterium]|nr:phospho-sugar mutase [Bacteroidales bacterium]